MNIREIFQRAKSRTLQEQWLYLPTDVEWTLDTDGTFLDWESEQKGSDEIPLVAKQKNLRETLYTTEIKEVVDWADRLAGREDDAARLDVFRYYFKFDAFPNKLGAPDPPPREEIVRQIDRQFYDSLGAEVPGTQCRHEGCERGTTKLSIFCRKHHFEQIKKKPCPFDN